MQMPTNRKDSGFTLIEMAIVLVIIGLIIGSVLKGQDLIQNARAKKFVNFARAAEIAQWTYLDRKGHFNGDDDKDGAIEATTLDWTGFENEPDNTLTLGSYNYTLYYTYDTNDTDNPSNVIAIVPKGTVFTDDELVFVESFDTAIDGDSNGTEGRVIACTVAAVGNGTDGAESFVDNSDDWDADNISSVIYYFDKK